MIERLLRQEVEVVPVSAGDPDRYNAPTRAEGEPVPYAAWIEQTRATELQVGRHTVIADWLLVLPAGAVIDAGDRVRHDGRTFEVTASPDRVRTPRGEHHVEALLRLVEG